MNNGVGVLHRLQAHLEAHFLGISGRLRDFLSLIVSEDGIAAMLILVFFFLTRRLVTWLLGAALRRVVIAEYRSIGDDVAAALARPVRTLWLVLGILFAFEFVRSSEGGSLVHFSQRLIGTLAILTAYWAMFNLVTPLLTHAAPRTERMTASMADWCDKIIKAFIVFFAIAAVMEQWGVRIGPILTGFGIVGAAVALGAQTFFKNLIAGILILVEQRFQYGDWVKVGSTSGHIESIGFRSTRIRQFDDTVAQVPNSELSESAAVNVTQLRRWRIEWVIGVPYSTTADQLRTICTGIAAHLAASTDIVPADRASTIVRVDSFGGSSINILIYCFANTVSWAEWLRIKEELAYRVMEIVEGAGSSFAFPSTSLYVESLPRGVPDAFVPPPQGKPPAGA